MFYLYTVKSNDKPINVDRGRFVCYQLDQPIVAPKTFSHVIFGDNGHSLVDVLMNDFNVFVEIEGKLFESLLESLPQHGGLWRITCYTKIFALQPAAYQRLCLNDCFVHLKLASHFHASRAVITVHYHMEVDKLLER